jgi:hypothetical protein
MQIAKDGGISQTREQVKQEIALFEAQRVVAASAEVSKIEAKTEATQRLSAAIAQGAEAVRLAGLENKYADMRKGGSSEDAVSAQRRQDEAENQLKITEAAIKGVTAYRDTVAQLTLQIAALDKISKQSQDLVDYAIRRRELEDQVRQAQVDEALKAGTLKDGYRAFFTEMEKQAKKPGQILYEGMTKAVDGLSDSISKAITGQKANWGQMFKNIGDGMVKDSVKSVLQTGLGKLGEKFGLNLGPKPDGSSQALALWVRLADTGHVQGLGKNLPTTGLFGGGDKGGGVFSFLKGLFSSGGSEAASAGIEQVTSSIRFDQFAAGGNIPSGSIGLTGESGPELIMGPATVVPMGNMGGSNSHHVHYHVDARGADLGADARVRRGLKIAHDSAVSTSQRAIHENSSRTPRR